MPKTTPSKTTPTSKNARWWLALLLVSGLLVVNQQKALPDQYPNEPAAGEFSVNRAFVHVKRLSQGPRTSGSPAWDDARQYLEKQLKKLGFQTRLQHTLVTDGKRLRAQYITNLLARLPAATEHPDKPGNALLLMAHYDSVSRSPGAGDDASGVAAILESLRAWLAENPQPQRDVIVLFSDAEENGLLGAQAFVLKHPWLRDVGLVINLEARGSGGPAYLLLETSGGNRQLVEHMAQAGLPRPNTSSLAYSVYQWLPNDTDLSIFHQGPTDINGYNIAFIGDAFDYHTPLDRPDRLDLPSLAHQGEYLLPMLRYFTTLPNLDTEAESDQVFFTVPLWQGLVHFPMAWAKPLALAIALLGLVAITWAIRHRCFSFSLLASAALPLVQSLVLSVLLGRYGWKAVVALNPHFADMNLGYPYSGALWTGFFLALALCTSGWIWARWLSKASENNRTERLAAALAATALGWLFMGGLLLIPLPGAAFLWLVPLALLIMLLLTCWRRQSPLGWGILSLSVGLVLFPLLWQLPVALGLDALFLVCTLLALTAGVFLPALVQLAPGHRRWLTKGVCGLTIGLFLLAQWNASITVQQPQQNSLFYLQDTDNRQAWWLSFDHSDDPWKRAIMGPQVKQSGAFETIDRRYGRWIRKAAKAPVLNVPGFATEITDYHMVKATTDKTTNETPEPGKTTYRLSVRLRPLRPMDRMDLVTGTDIVLNHLSVNGQPFVLDNGKRRRASQSVLRYWLGDNTPIELELTFSSRQPPYFLLYGLSNDLFSNNSVTKKLNLPPRPATLISKPSTVTDAILTRQSLQLPNVPDGHH